MTYFTACIPTSRITRRTVSSYNIIKESEVKWRIELALAGWAPEDVEVSTESNVLLIKSKTAKGRNDEDEYMHRGVSLVPSQEVSTWQTMWKSAQSGSQTVCSW